MSKDVTPLLNEIASAVTYKKKRYVPDRRQNDEGSINLNNKGSIHVGGSVFLGRGEQLENSPPLKTERHANLINCPDCTAVVSRRSRSCKRCGLDVAEHFVSLGDYKHAKSVVKRSRNVRNIMLLISLAISMAYYFELNLNENIISSFVLGVILLFCAPAAYALELTRSKFEKVIFRSQFYRAGDEKG